ncbi:MAG: PEP-utilizing enzyme [Actinomycetota bacterium]
MTSWPIEGAVDERWPLYTRGNIGEVFPEVVTTLGYELCVVPAERGWRRAFDRLGIAREGDFASEEPVILGTFSGYAYLNLSYNRMMGVRAPGSSAEAIDTAFFGEGDPPPYVPRPGDRSLRSSLRILRTVLAALRTRELPELVDDSRRRTDDFIARRPALDASDQDLLDYLTSYPAAFDPVFANHITTSVTAAIVSGPLSDAAVAAGDPGLVTHLMGAAGDVKSAEYSRDLHAIAQHVKSSPVLSGAFDDGIEGLADRLAGLSGEDAQSFQRMFEGFIATHGHRGPNDWDITSRTWDNTPELALIAIDRMRIAEDDPSADQQVDDDARRKAAIDAVRPHLSAADRLAFGQAIKAMPYWTQAREATRDLGVRIILPAKQAYRELVRRAAERGGAADPIETALLSSAELPAYLADPASMLDVIAERSATLRRYQAITPQFFVGGSHEVPTLEGLEAEQASSTSTSQVSSGEVLTGRAGCSGVAEGTVRVILDPADAAELNPGDVLVAPHTDPSWTPLFMPASAVVVNVGSLMSHAVIVARELDIPCVVAVEGATEQLRDGMHVRVDGTAATVTVL